MAVAKEAIFGSNAVISKRRGGYKQTVHQWLLSPAKKVDKRKLDRRRRSRKGGKKDGLTFLIETGAKALQAITLQIGEEEVPNLLIDSGPACNVVDKETWRWLKNENIKAGTPKLAKTLHVYGSSKPLPTLKTFTAK